MSKTTKEVATSAKVEINVKKITSAGNLFKATPRFQAVQASTQGSKRGEETGEGTIGGVISYENGDPAPGATVIMERTDSDAYPHPREGSEAHVIT